MCIHNYNVIHINSDTNICIVLKNDIENVINYKCSDIILTVLKNNDILIRDKEFAYLTTKMNIIRAKSIDYIKIQDIVIKLENNKWTIK